MDHWVGAVEDSTRIDLLDPLWFFVSGGVYAKERVNTG